MTDTILNTIRLPNTNFERLHERLISQLKRRIGGDHISEQVLAAMRNVPRHLFVRESDMAKAYEDYPLSIGHGQTISAPHIVGIMCSLLEIEKGMKILEIGGGSGYHAAVLAELTGPGGMVYAIERITELAEFARQNLTDAGYENVVVTAGDGTLGLPEHAPYDCITVACAAPAVPQPLVDQLKRGGRMTIPIGEYTQELYLIHKNDVISNEKKGGVVFVPLIGEYGF
ncbi:MAG: protein-L-isoaspartate O-methyltransferase [Candidatus Methanogaster sp.]|uniref:Protein-L-isoaspartate O-methyltransferase n=1 Tax=Candidatus Methanogaster sp. TaxID=3386292 RepID=A0AC61L1H7_9EURY|nr:MAG: protein-L-isoaspartate O-methyltransferase [ANME-2 cluster archaeon]